MVKYIPKQGDIVYMDFNPTKAHEQKGKRPAIIISNDVFNINTKMAILCPITSNTKEFPTHYELEDSKKVKGKLQSLLKTCAYHDLEEGQYLQRRNLSQAASEQTHFLEDLMLWLPYLDQIS